MVVWPANEALNSWYRFSFGGLFMNGRRRLVYRISLIYLVSYSPVGENIYLLYMSNN